jgi:DNA modification methylase
VLDPFAGAGTVGLVCQDLGRDFIGIDLSADYLRMARRRIKAAGRPLFEAPAPVQAQANGKPHNGQTQAMMFGEAIEG